MSYDFLNNNEKNDKSQNETEAVTLEKSTTSANSFESTKTESTIEPVIAMPPPLPPLMDTSDFPEEKRLQGRKVEKMTPEQYHERLLELNTNAENKHYVLFFGKPASGKTFIIGSILYYMKNVLGGTVYLDDERSTDSERELFIQLQNRFAGERFSKRIGRTSTDEYYEFHIHFTPKDSTKLPLDIVFVDASGEHSDRVALDRENIDTGDLPDYLRVILESDVNTKLAFVYDKFLQAQQNKSSQVSMLDQIFTKIQLLQRRQQKYYPKILLLAKSDKIEAEDGATVEKYAYSATQYAQGVIPNFANGFFNESAENRAIFYKMGIFSSNDDLLLKFDDTCPAKLFAWLYKQSNLGDLENPPTCWEKFIRWFKGK